jgi:hypothetical protein
MLWRDVDAYTPRQQHQLLMLRRDFIMGAPRYT